MSWVERVGFHGSVLLCGLHLGAAWQRGGPRHAGWRPGGPGHFRASGRCRRVGVAMRGLGPILALAVLAGCGADGRPVPPPAKPAGAGQVSSEMPLAAATAAR